MADEIRSRLIEIVANSQLRYATRRDGNGEVPYDQAVEDVLHECYGFFTDENTEKLPEVVARCGKRLAAYIKGLSSRVFMPYSFLEMEIDINMELVDTLDCVDKERTLDELQKAGESFSRYAEQVDEMVMRLRRIARREGEEYAFRPRTRDRVVRAVFGSPNDYGSMMMQGVTSAVTAAYLGPVRIAWMGRERKSKKLRGFAVRSIGTVDTKESEDERWVDANLSMRIFKMYLIHEIKRMWD